MSKSLLKAFFIVIIGSLTWFSPIAAMQQERELCEQCDKRTAKRVYIDPEGEESPSWMKLCGKCEKSIREYIEDKQIENERGARDLRAFEKEVRVIHQDIRVVPTPPPAIPKNVQYPVRQKNSGTTTNQ